MNNQKTLYKTKDLGEVASLILADEKPVDTLRENEVCWFLFEDSNARKTTTESYFFGKMSVNAREFQELLRTLKRRVMQT